MFVESPTARKSRRTPRPRAARPRPGRRAKTDVVVQAFAHAYEAGVASYKEIARGQLLGDETGMLKLLIHQDNHKILGVHLTAREQNGFERNR